MVSSDFNISAEIKLIINNCIVKMSFVLSCLLGTNKRKTHRKLLSESHITHSKTLNTIEEVVSGNVETFASTQSLINHEGQLRSIKEQKMDSEKQFLHNSSIEKDELEKKSDDESNTAQEAIESNLLKELFSVEERYEIVAEMRSKSPVITRSLPQFEPEKKSRFSIQKISGHHRASSGVVSVKSTLNTLNVPSSRNGRSPKSQKRGSKSDVYKF